MDQWFQSYSSTVLKDFQNNIKTKNAVFFLAVSHNQCSRLPTDPARSQPICGSRTRIRVAQWENAFTRCQSLSKSRANFDAIRLVQARFSKFIPYFKVNRV